MRLEWVAESDSGVGGEKIKDIKVSVVMGTSRPGGIDISLRGMAHQTYDNFEVILVDGRYHKRHAEVLDFAESLDIDDRLIHVPNHRNNGYWNVFCAGWNTGFMLAEGEIVIMLLDYAYAPPGWIENHLKYHEGKKRLVMSPHIYVEMPEVVTRNGEPPRVYDQGNRSVTEDISHEWDNFDEISIFREYFDPAWLSKLREYQHPHRDPKLDQNPGLISYQYMHAKNESFPLDVVLDIGGIDENFDRGKGPMDNEFGFRFMMAGCELFLTHDAKVYCLNPRFILPSRPWGDMEKRVSNRWSYKDGEDYQNQRYAEIGAGAPVKSNNPYDMRERRKEIWHWRNLSKRREPAIPLVDIPDEEWYR